MLRPNGKKSVFAGRGGLSEKNINERSGGNRDKDLVFFKDGEAVPLQFAGEPSHKTAFKEFEQHGWKNARGGWTFVPCPETEDCVCCTDEDEDIARTSYAFAAQVWSFKDRAMKVVSGGTNLAQQIVFKYKRAPDKFARRVWDVTKLATKPKSYDVTVSETVRPIRLADKEAVDLDGYLKRRYDTYAKTVGGSRKSTLEADDEEDYEDEELDEEEAPTRKQMTKMDWADLKRYAKSVGVTERITKRSELIDAIEEALEE